MSVAHIFDHKWFHQCCRIFLAAGSGKAKVLTLQTPSKVWPPVLLGSSGLHFLAAQKRSTCVNAICAGQDPLGPFAVAPLTTSGLNFSKKPSCGANVASCSELEGGKRYGTNQCHQLSAQLVPSPSLSLLEVYDSSNCPSYCVHLSWSFSRSSCPQVS